MSRAAEALAFVALAVGLHLGLFWRNEAGAPDAAGAGGGDSVTVRAANAEVARMLAALERPRDAVEPLPPEPSAAPPEPAATPEAAPAAPPSERTPPPPEPDLAAALPKSPEMPGALTATPDLALPDPPAPAPDAGSLAGVPPPPAAPPDPPDPALAAPAAAPEAPRPDATARPAEPPRLSVPAPPDQAAPEPEPGLAASPAPQRRPAELAARPQTAAPQPQSQREARPDPAPQPEGTAEPRQAQRAAGVGGGAEAGRSGSGQTANLSPAQRQSLVAAWGQRIHSRIERRKYWPRGVREAGTASVWMLVAGDGRVLQIQLARSSGIPVLDEAALASVRRAGRFPAAPADLGPGPHRITVPIHFAR